MKKVTGQGGAFRRRIRQVARGCSSGAQSACVVGLREARGENSRGKRDHRRERRGEGARRGVLRACYVKSMAMACLENMSEDWVPEGVEMLARRSNEITAELLAYLSGASARSTGWSPRSRRGRTSRRGSWRCRSRSGRPTRRPRGVGFEVRAPERARRARVAALSPRRHEIRVTVDGAIHRRRQGTALLVVEGAAVIDHGAELMRRRRGARRPRASRRAAQHGTLDETRWD
jgi:hypothetical protein